MNIDFKAAFESGMKPEDIREMMERQYALAEQEYNEAQEAARIKAEEAKAAAQKANDKEALKREARAHAINAMIAYSEAFDISDEPWTEEDVAKAEKLLLQFEAMLPTYIKLIELQGELGDGFGLALGGGLF